MCFKLTFATKQTMGVRNASYAQFICCFMIEDTRNIKKGVPVTQEHFKEVPRDYELSMASKAK